MLVRKGPVTWEVVVTGLAERRGPARDAALLYAEDEASIAARRETLARRTAPLGEAGDDDVPGDRTLAHQHAIARLERARRLRALAVDAHRAGLDRVAGECPRFVETRGPQPAVETDAPGVGRGACAAHEAGGSAYARVQHGSRNDCSRSGACDRVGSGDAGVTGVANAVSCMSRAPAVRTSGSKGREG